MSDYYQKMYKRIQDNVFVRTFLGSCPKCGTKLFSTDELIDVENNRIVGEFICPKCDKKYKQTMIDFKKHPCKYRYPQGLLETIRVKGKNVKVIHCEGRYYLFKPDRILSKPDKENKNGQQ